jgi:hypothetical protein
MFFFQDVCLSGRLAGQGQMHECRRCQNAPTSHPAGASVPSVVPRQQCDLRRDDVMMRGAWIADAWRGEVVQITSSLFIRITKYLLHFNMDPKCITDSK